MEKRSKATLPAASRPDMLAIPWQEMTSADKLHSATHQALDRMRRVLEPVVDVSRFTDAEWLANPENRKLAVVQLKFVALQTQVALGIMAGQMKVDEARLRSTSEKEAQTAALVRALGERLGVAEEPKRG